MTYDLNSLVFQRRDVGAVLVDEVEGHFGSHVRIGLPKRIDGEENVVDNGVVVRIDVVGRLNSESLHRENRLAVPEHLDFFVRKGTERGIRSDESLEECGGIVDFLVLEQSHYPVGRCENRSRVGCRHFVFGLFLFLSTALALGAGTESDGKRGQAKRKNM